MPSRGTSGDSPSQAGPALPLNAAQAPAAGTRVEPPRAAIAPRIAVGYSAREGLDGAIEAAERAAADLAAQGAGTCTLAMMFATAAWGRSLPQSVASAARRLSPSHLLAGTVESVVAGSVEHQDQPGFAVFALEAPAVAVRAFATEDLPLLYWASAGPEDAARSPGQLALEDQARLTSVVGFGPQHRATFLLVDPFAVRLPAVLAGFDAARAHWAAASEPAGLRAGPVLGGILSASRRPRGNTIVLNDRALKEGIAGLSLLGGIRVEPVVSQGCRPIGPNLIVTAAKGNVLARLGHTTALEALNRAVDTLPVADRALLARGVFVGRVADEYRERFGRGDYLIRGVLGVSKNSGEISLNDEFRVGQTVRFHVRDPAAASADLAMLLDAQRLSPPPAGALLFTCNGRGRHMFDTPHHDASALARLFAHDTPGEASARAGLPIGAPPRTPPIAGFFASGEIGPAGPITTTHGFTACAALFRAEA